MHRTRNTNQYFAQHKVKLSAGNKQAGKTRDSSDKYEFESPIGAIFTTTVVPF